MRLVERYRPDTLDDIVGQDQIVRSLKWLAARIKAGEATEHMLFIGPPGTGKTTAAMAMAKEIWGNAWKSHFREFNASDARKIEDVRERYKPISKHKGQRMLYLGEADRMTQDAQHAMRRVMELTPSTIFVLSGNQGWRIIDAIKSRCIIYRFNRLDDGAVAKRLMRVIKAEGIKVDLKDTNIRSGLTLLVKEARGDMRQALNTLQKLVTEDKEITPEAVLMLRRPKLAMDAMMRALGGDFQGGKELMEDAFITGGFSVEAVIEELYEGLERVEDERVRVRLYRELGEVADRCRRGNPILHLVSFIAYAWVAPRLSKCPALGDEK